MKQSFAEAWRDYRALLLFGFAYVILCCAQILHFGLSPSGLFGWIWLAIRHVLGLSALFLALVMIGGFFREVWRSPANEIPAYKAWVKQYFNGPMFAGACLGFLACFESLFFIMQKATIRFANPYSWDTFFAGLDKSLHFGRYPHEWLMAVFGDRGLDTVLQLFYVGWFFFMYVALGYALFCERDRARRLRFVSCYVLGWCLLGGFVATYFSSAGPIFYHDIYPQLPDIYKPLSDYFTRHRDEVGGFYFLYDNLLLWYRHKAQLVPNAPSAMPSLHAATSTLIVLYAWGINRAVFGIALFCAVGIVISSIYFGFHYAVDSYFSIAAMSLMWWLAGKYARKKVQA